MPGGAVADPLEAPARDRDVLFENALGAAADPQIDIADDAGDAPRLAVFAGSAHRRDAVDEFGLAERLQLLRAVGAVHLAAFLKTGRGDVVAAADIVEQILKQVAVAGPVPHVMVRVDDRQSRARSSPPCACRASPGGPARGGRAGSRIEAWGSPPEVALALPQLCPAAPPNSTALSERHRILP